MVNPRISEILEAFNVPQKDGVAYLLSIYYECIPSYIPPVIVQKINASQIIKIDPQGNIDWMVPLFTKEEDNSKWGWVETEFMELFANLNKKRKGTKSSCIARMKSFFAENPDVRKEDVLGATKMYMQNVSNPEYLITSHYFIFKDKGKDKVSALEEWLEKYKLYLSVTPSTAAGSASVSDQMQ